MASQTTPTKKQLKVDAESPARTVDTTPPVSPLGTITVRTETSSPRTVLPPAVQKNLFCIAILFVLFAFASAGGLWGWLFKIPGLKTQIQQLESQVNRLSGQVDRLSDQNDRYEELNSELDGTVTVLRGVTVELHNTTTFLEEVVDNLNVTADTLSQVNSNLTAENRRFADLNEDLLSLVTFLNQTVGVLNLEDLIESISEQINTQRILFLANLRTSFSNRLLTWDCSFRDVFRTRGFVQDETVPIADAQQPEQLNQVLQYVTTQLLSPFCLEREDFENFLGNTTTTMTLTDLSQSASVYFQEAEEYYFSGNEITSQDWAEAKFSCENLAPFQYSQ